jgi:hypothetical protein
MRAPAFTERNPRLGGSAPRFLVIYCSVMIILLAFFILLQTLETSKERARFRKGKGSFIRALETYGLGRVMGRELPRSRSGARMPRMYATETEADSRSDEKPLDPEKQAAARAIEKLRRSLEDGSAPLPDRRVMLALPLAADGGGLTEGRRSYLEKFAHRLLPLLLGRNCIVNVATLYRATDATEVRVARGAGRTAHAVREHLLSALPEAERERARRLV